MKRLAIEPSKLAAFCEANGIRRLSLFGSQLHGTARPDSDIDLLVEFYPDRIPGFFGITRMEHELSEMVEGRKIDITVDKEIVWMTATVDIPHFVSEIKRVGLDQLKD
jgi:uncharacterized protein